MNSEYFGETYVTSIVTDVPENVFAENDMNLYVNKIFELQVSAFNSNELNRCWEKKCINSEWVHKKK